MNLGNVALGFFATIGLFFCAVLLFCAAAAWREQRRFEARKKAHLEAFAKREKARIVTIGTIIRDPLGGEHPFGFTLDCECRVPPFGIGPAGEILSGGWTNRELVEIAKRRKEWEG